MNSHYPFALQPLPYGWSGLQPCLSADVVCNHYEHHHRHYVNRLNQLLQPYPTYQDWTLEQLLTDCQTLPEEIRSAVLFNAGGVYNHNLYWCSMAPCRYTSPTGALAKAIACQYGSFQLFQQQFKASAMALTGSGWTWLAADCDGSLSIQNTANQQVPDLNVLTPLLVVDLWEHAYYLQYRSNRERYLDNWWYLTNWGFADSQYRQSMTE